MSRAAGFALAAMVWSAAAPAHAATSIRATASAPQAEVGQGVRVEVSVLTDGDDDPGNPRLVAPPGFTVQGPSVSSSRQISFTNGAFENRHGITATWVVAGSKPGQFTIGPATVQVGKSALTSQTMAIEIVAPGTLPRPRRPRGFFDPNDPLDPFSLIPGMPGMRDLDDAPPVDVVPDAPSEYLVEKALDSLAFVRATATPSEAVVGQQVTLKIYAYGRRGPFDEIGSSEPSRPDFLSQSLVDSSFRQRRFTVPIDGEGWSAVKVREVALFPLKAGSLAIGPMRMGFRGRAYPDSGPPGGLRRQSAPLVVHVVEPPMRGRPAGYELGDVGAYSLAAEVDPRRVEAGGAVSVSVRIEGKGNVPRRVKTPEVQGVEWLTPTVTDSMTVTDGAVGGARVIRYVVQLDCAGTVDLGEVTLPYYDPAARRYEVARASLGAVEVTPVPGAATGAAPGASAAPPKTAEPAVDPFAGLGGMRKDLGPAPPPPSLRTDRAWFWALVLGAPILVVLGRALVLLAGRLRVRAASRKASAAAVAKRALDDARTAAGKRDGAQVAAALERAVYTTVEDRLGLRARAVLRAELAPLLERSGADAELARETVKVLDDCDGLRFGGASAADAVVARAETVVKRMGRSVRPMPGREAT